jgi:hypothetical protein
VRRLVRLATVVLTLSVAPAAAAVGPSMPAIDGGAGVASPAENVSYSTVLDGTNTTLRVLSDGELLRSATLPGMWGVPMVTFGSGLGGLSTNGRVLVLSDNIQPSGTLRSRSRFAVVDTKTLSVSRLVSLRGDFSFDALSPQGTTLFLIDHVSKADVTKYQVRAYDLGAGRLLPRVIADKTQAGWVMSGMPVTRATSTNGEWVYTLYEQSQNYPFIHALNTVSKTAICVGLPWNWTASNAGISTARLTLSGGQLRISGGQGSGARFLLDTKTFRIAR